VLRHAMRGLKEPVRTRDLADFRLTSSYCRVSDRHVVIERRYGLISYGQFIEPNILTEKTRVLRP